MHRVTFFPADSRHRTRIGSDEQPRGAAQSTKGQGRHGDSRKHGLGARSCSMTDFLQTVKERVVVYDGAMGTNIQFRNPSVDDFWGKEGCNELLVLSRPDIIKDIHASFFKVGCDVVETNTFGSTRVVLAEYELQDKTAELNIAAARLAKEVAQQFSTPGRPRFVAGSMGPTTKLPSLGHITFDNMAAAYEEQAAALIDGGVDVLLVETSQDLLQAKAALVGVFDAMQKAGKRLPVTVQVTLEATGTMLLGTEIGAAAPL